MATRGSEGGPAPKWEMFLRQSDVTTLAFIALAVSWMPWLYAAEPSRRSAADEPVVIDNVFIPHDSRLVARVARDGSVESPNADSTKASTENALVEFVQPSLALQKNEGSLQKNAQASLQDVHDEFRDALARIRSGAPGAKGAVTAADVEFRRGYETVLNGVAVSLSPDELNAVKTLPYVKKVHSDFRSQALYTRLERTRTSSSTPPPPRPRSRLLPPIQRKATALHFGFPSVNPSARRSPRRSRSLERSHNTQHSV